MEWQGGDYAPGGGGTVSAGALSKGLYGVYQRSCMKAVIRLKHIFFLP